MRVLKFRAWDKRNNKWIHQDLHILTNAGFYIDYRAFEDGCSLFDYEYELMQYTGLKDKNGMDIYEGDVILKVTTGSLFEVYYRENSACFRVKRQDGWHFDLKDIFPINDWKVVGNIYEKFDWNF